MIMIKSDLNDLLNMNSRSSRSTSRSSNSSNSSFGIQRYQAGEVSLDAQEHHNQLERQGGLLLSAAHLESRFKIEGRSQQEGEQLQQHQQLLNQQIAAIQQQHLEQNQRQLNNQQQHSQQQQHSLQSQQQQQQLQQQSQQQPHQPQQQQQQQQQQPLQAQSNQQQQQTGADGKPKRNPYCSRCRNHGKSAQVKGHKRHCEYRDCQCEGCKLVECRQIVSAAQIKRRRYQKQDEECGRRIEISPPVLKRPRLSADGDQANDPATLIAKTLIGSASSKQLQQHQTHQQCALAQAQKQLVVAQHRLHTAHLPGLQQAAAAANFAAASSSSSLASANHQHHQTNNQPPLPMHAAHLNLNLNQQSPLANSAGLAGSPSSSALSNAALHLLHFPGSVLSAAANLGGPLKPHPSSLITNPTGFTAGPFTDSNTSNNPAPLPNSREQISLVEDIHQTYGPLAVYAWLKAENFDLEKVRDLIELSKVAFDELLQITGRSPLDLTSPQVD